jgi:hypothetical protein
MFPSLNSQLAINTPTVVKPQAGRIMKVSVLVAGTAAGGVYDSQTTSAAALQNQVAVIPAAIAVIDLQFQCRNGITVVPGTGQTLAVSFA